MTVVLRRAVGFLHSPAKRLLEGRLMVPLLIRCSGHWLRRW